MAVGKWPLKLQAIIHKRDQAHPKAVQSRGCVFAVIVADSGEVRQTGGEAWRVSEAPALGCPKGCCCGGVGCRRERNSQHRKGKPRRIEAAP